MVATTSAPTVSPAPAARTMVRGSMVDQGARRPRHDHRAGRAVGSRDRRRNRRAGLHALNAYDDRLRRAWHDIDLLGPIEIAALASGHHVTAWFDVPLEGPEGTAADELVVHANFSIVQVGVDDQRAQVFAGFLQGLRGKLALATDAVLGARRNASKCRAASTLLPVPSSASPRFWRNTGWG